MGNHDYWPQGDLTIKKGGDKCNAMLHDMGLHNVKVLDCDTYEDGEFLFVGCTLWTDMNDLDPFTMYNMTNCMRYDGKIAYETGGSIGYSKFTSEKWIQTFFKHRDYLKIIAEQNKDKKLIVLTHHLPLRILSDPRYSMTDSDGYYSSDLSDFILDNPHIKMWFYGHTHFQYDKMFEQCRMLNNCVGYESEHNEYMRLVKHEVIEI